MIFHSISNTLNTSESVLLSAILDLPEKPLVPREKAYPVFTGPVRQKNAAKAIQSGLHRILLRRHQTALPKTVIQDAVWKAMRFKQVATTQRDLQAIKRRLTSDWQYHLANLRLYTLDWARFEESYRIGYDLRNKYSFCKQQERCNIAYVLDVLEKSWAQLEHSRLPDILIVEEEPQLTVPVANEIDEKNDGPSTKEIYTLFIFVARQ